jgi:hypothetical protein
MQKPEVKLIELISKFDNNKEYVMILVKECINAAQYEVYIPHKVPPIETKEFWLSVKKELEKLN